MILSEALVTSYEEYNNSIESLVVSYEEYNDTIESLETNYEEAQGNRTLERYEKVKLAIKSIVWGTYNTFN